MRSTYAPYERSDCIAARYTRPFHFNDVSSWCHKCFSAVCAAQALDMCVHFYYRGAVLRQATGQVIGTAYLSSRSSVMLGTIDVKSCKRRTL